MVVSCSLLFVASFNEGFFRLFFTVQLHAESNVYFVNILLNEYFIAIFDSFIERLEHGSPVPPHL